QAVFIGGMLVIFSIACIIYIQRGRAFKVLLFPEGVAFIRGWYCEVFRWDEVEAVWVRIRHVYNEDGTTQGTSYLYTVRCEDGRRLRFDDRIVDVERLGARIIRETTSVVLPLVQQAFDEGKRLDCGPLQVDQSGITLD